MGYEVIEPVKSAKANVNKVVVGILFVFFGCCGNIYFLELVVRLDPGAGNLASFCLFVVITVEGFITTRRCGTKSVVIPMKAYIMLVILYFVANFANNMAFKYHVSMTLNLVFKSGSLVANLILGIIFLHKKYRMDKYASVFLVTVGIGVCTFASAREKQVSAKGIPLSSAVASVENQTDVVTAMAEFGEGITLWCAGVAFMAASVFATAGVGIFQEFMFKKYGKEPREALFFTHFLPLPGFLLLWNDLSAHITRANETEKILVAGMIHAPRLWVYIAANTAFQCICINSVFLLTSECTSLTVSLVLTLRKFLSLLLSIFIFGANYTWKHWLGTGLVFLGTALYENPFVSPSPQLPLSEEGNVERKKLLREQGT